MLSTVNGPWRGGSFPVLTCCVTILNPDSLSSSEIRNGGIRSWEMHLTVWAWCLKAIGGIYLTKKWRAEILQPWFRIWRFQTLAWKRYHQVHLQAERSVSLGDDRSFLKERFESYRQPGLLCTPRNFAQGSNFFRKRIFFVTKVTPLRPF